MYNNNSDINFKNLPAREDSYDYQFALSDAMYKLTEKFLGTKYESIKFSELGMGITVIPYHYEGVIKELNYTNIKDTSLRYLLEELFSSNINMGRENVMYSTVANLKQEIIF